MLVSCIFFMHCKQNYLWRNSSRGSQMLLKLGIFKNFENFTGKASVLESLLKKILVVRTCNFIKKMFSCKICEIFNSSLFTEHLRWLFFKIAAVTIQKSVQRFFANIAYTQQISDHLQLSQWQTNLKMQKLPIEHFCNIFKTKS